MLDIKTVEDALEIMLSDLGCLPNEARSTDPGIG